MKKIERPIYIRNVNGIFNRKGLIEHTVEVNILYKEQRENSDQCDRETEVEYNPRNVITHSLQF